MTSDSLSHGELLGKLDYNPETGEFRWKVKVAIRVKPGQIAGCRDESSGGYWKVGIRGRYYKAHRLAWFYVHGSWPDGEIDHIDRNGFNNSIKNLRVVSRSQNMQNSNMRKPSDTGVRGVHRLPSGRFRAILTANHVTHRLGTFDTLEQASAAYWRAKEDLHEFSPVAPD